MSSHSLSQLLTILVVHILLSMEMKQGCIHASSLFNTFKDWVFGSRESLCEEYVNNTQVTDLYFTSDAVIC